MTHQYGLFFSLELRSSSSLIWGKLDLLYLPEFRVIERYIATSGTAGNQNLGSQAARGKGCIPRQDNVGIQHYLVKTAPIDLRSTKGVEGSFFPIIPFAVEFKSGIKRGDFGIHFDANVPGSAGCIVIKNKPAYADFEKRMAQLKSEEEEEIPLLIEYSF